MFWFDPMLFAKRCLPLAQRFWRGTLVFAANPLIRDTRTHLDIVRTFRVRENPDNVHECPRTSDDQFPDRN